MTVVIGGDALSERGRNAETDLGTVLLGMNLRQQQHGEILMAILTMLRGEDDKNASNDLIKDLMNRIDHQTAMIRALLVSVTSLGKDVPATVLRMLREETGQSGDDYHRTVQHTDQPHANGRGTA